MRAVLDTGPMQKRSVGDEVLLGNDPQAMSHVGSISSAVRLARVTDERARSSRGSR